MQKKREGKEREKREKRERKEREKREKRERKEKREKRGKREESQSNLIDPLFVHVGSVTILVKKILNATNEVRFIEVGLMIMNECFAKVCIERR